MTFFRWLKFKKILKKQINMPFDKSMHLLIENTLNLFPKTIDISDGCLRGKKDFYSKNLSGAWHNAEDSNNNNTGDADFMIWAVYRVLHNKCRLSYKSGINTVNISDLSYEDIRIEYIKACLEAEN